MIKQLQYYYILMCKLKNVPLTSGTFLYNCYLLLTCEKQNKHKFSFFI